MSCSEQRTKQIVSECAPETQALFDIEIETARNGYCPRKSRKLEFPVTFVFENRLSRDASAPSVPELPPLSQPPIHRRSGTVLVTGATRRTGSLLDKERRNRGQNV